MTTAKPRRTPKQSRAKNTVDAIIQAAEEVFRDKGYSNATIEDITRKAGVGIGSLYDYFPNKTAVALALLETVSADIANESRRYFLEFGKDPIDVSFPKVVRKIYFSYKRHKDVFNELSASSEIKFAADAYTVDKLIYRASLIYLQIYEDQIGVKSINKIHSFLTFAFSSCIKQYLQNDEPDLEEEEFLSFLSEMFLSYVLAQNAG